MVISGKRVKWGKSDFMFSHVHCKYNAIVSPVFTGLGIGDNTFPLAIKKQLKLLFNHLTHKSKK